MLLTRRRRTIKRISLCTLKVLLLVTFVVFVLLPIIFKYNIALQRNILFLTFIKYPGNTTFNKPENYGLYATRNFFAFNDRTPKTVVQIGVWHVLPNIIAAKFSHQLNLTEDDLTTIDSANKSINKDLSASEQQLQREYPKSLVGQDRDEFFMRTLKMAPARGVILYLHGNTASRAAGHRVDLYKVLRAMDYHVVALDYRGYGDSAQDPPPSEAGVVSDALTVYEYLVKLTDGAVPIFLWGHSLGTGVACHMLSLQKEKGPRALVLESPFNNIHDEILEHPFSALFRNLPWFERTISKPLHANELRFESDRHISEFRQPILILHAEDDLVVPFKLGYKLYRAALDGRRKGWGPVVFERFTSAAGFGHKFICRAPHLPKLINEFFDLYRNESYY